MMLIGCGLFLVLDEMDACGACQSRMADEIEIGNVKTNKTNCKILVS